MKAVKLPLAGRERYLCFTVEAMFQLREEFGGTGELLEAVKPDTREGFAAACKAAAILAEQGELARRSLGYDPEPILEAGALQAAATPVDIVRLKLALPTTLALGYGREIEPEDADVDLGLAELNEQKKTR